MVVVPHYIPHSTSHPAPVEEPSTYRVPVTVPHAAPSSPPRRVDNEGPAIALTDEQKRGFTIFVLCMLGVLLLLVGIASYQTRGNDPGP